MRVLTAEQAVQQIQGRIILAHTPDNDQAYVSAMVHLATLNSGNIRLELTPQPVELTEYNGLPVRHRRCVPTILVPEKIIELDDGTIHITGPLPGYPGGDISRTQVFLP